MSGTINMLDWKRDVIMSAYKRGIPVLSFPSVLQLGCTVKEMIFSSDLQAQGMKIVADRTPSLATLSMMNLTVEAEAFGAKVRYEDDEIPATIGELVKTLEDAENLVVPEVGAGLTQVYIDATRKACEMITDRPVFAGIIGPFTLAGRLIGIAPIMKAIKKNPEMVRIVMRKCTDFLIKYAQAYKDQTGASGFVMAEPTTGLISPKMAAEFSHPYTQEVIEAVQDEYFVVLYHNCGDTVVNDARNIAKLTPEGYHYGNIIKMEDILPYMPKDRLVMGNLDPSAYFCLESPEKVRTATLELLEKCCRYPNFVISSGCDTAPIAKWENVDAFYRAIDEYYTSHGIHSEFVDNFYANHPELCK